MNPTRIVNDTRYFYFTIRRLFMNIRRLLSSPQKLDKQLGVHYEVQKTWY